MTINCRISREKYQLVRFRNMVQVAYKAFRCSKSIVQHVIIKTWVIVNRYKYIIVVKGMCLFCVYVCMYVDTPTLNSENLKDWQLCEQLNTLENFLGLLLGALMKMCILWSLHHISTWISRFCINQILTVVFCAWS